MYNISILPQRFPFRHLAPADEQSGSSDWGGFVPADRARLRAPVIPKVLGQEERRKWTRPYMNNETLTRKQNQKPCDLTSPVCTSLAGPHTAQDASMQGCG